MSSISLGKQAWPPPPRSGCVFDDSGDFLGHHVTASGIMLLPDGVSATVPYPTAPQYLPYLGEVWKGPRTKNRFMQWVLFTEMCYVPYRTLYRTYSIVGE